MAALSETLYHQLYTLLQAKPESIEILPAEWKSSPTNPHHPFEFTENHLGIPKRVYYTTYLQAVRRFEQLLEEVQAKENRTELIEVTCVVLLVNPAHSTCLNKRRALVEEGLLAGKDELTLISSLQLLRESSKSSILWSYRRWILRKLYGAADISHDADSLDGVAIPLESISQELAIATTASEVYPRNYHAWLHRYKCLDSLASSFPSTAPSTLLSQVLRAEEFAITKWVEMNVGDYSAMQYLCHLYTTMEKLGIQHIQMHADEDEGDRSDKKVVTVPFSPWEHATELVQRYPMHESLWYYLRTSHAVQGSPTEINVQISRQEPYFANLERWKTSFESLRGT